MWRSDPQGDSERAISSAHAAWLEPDRGEADWEPIGMPWDCEYCGLHSYGKPPFEHHKLPVCSVGCVASLEAMDAAAETSDVDIIAVAIIAVGLISYGLGVWS